MGTPGSLPFSLLTTLKTLSCIKSSVRMLPFLLPRVVVSTIGEVHLPSPSHGGDCDCPAPPDWRINWHTRFNNDVQDMCTWFAHNVFGWPQLHCRFSAAFARARRKKLRELQALSLQGPPSHGADAAVSCSSPRDELGVPGLHMSEVNCVRVDREHCGIVIACVHKNRLTPEV